MSIFLSLITTNSFQLLILVKDSSPKSESELADIYFRTVGRGATLLMNLSPNKNGEVGATQLNRFKELGKNISDTFKTDLTWPGWRLHG